MSDPYASNYHIAQGENVQGPYSYTQVLELIQQGKARPDMLYSRDGADWLEGYDLPELFPDPDGASGAPPAPVRGGGRHAHRGRSRRRLEPHRGGSILALGIIGLVLCWICSIIAWVMANTDLAKMRAGRMARDGEGMTNAGKILGIIGTILAFGWIIVVMMFLLGGAAVSTTSY